MRRSTVFLATAAALGMLALGAAPASAAPRPLPEGDALYSLPCNYYSAPAADLPALQLLDVETTTGAATAIGSGTAIPDVDCAGQGAWDATTGTAYALAFSFLASTEPQLVSIDIATGASTVIGTFSDGTDPVDVYAIAIDSEGNAFAMSDGLYSLDLDTALVTYIGGSTSNYTLAFDPNDVLYTLGTGGALATINPVTGAETPYGTISPSISGSVYSLAIDSDGIMWFGMDDGIGGGFYEVTLASVDPANLTSVEVSGNLAVGEVAPFQESLFVAPAPTPAPAPAPQLAATGAAVDPSWFVGAGILGLAGVALVVRRRAA